MSNLPPASFEGVFEMSASVDIDAPIESVWEILLDFPSYRKWNTFIHSQAVVDKSKKPLPDQAPQVGQFLLMEAHIPPTAALEHPPTSRPLERITHVDSSTHRLAWVYTAGVPGFLMRAERWQALSVVDGKTRYESRETFGGFGGYAVKYSMRADLQKSFDVMGEDLKKYAEEHR
ncbi:hypothetical protein B0H21DRAFT_770865 [Amylocystis lapponica]|nr:hypothetical protein B0H21DRAFT_770865 [Amylocystis lapponica]